MAAKKKKKQAVRKKTVTKKNSRKTQSKTQPELQRVCLTLCFIVFCSMAILRFGPLGIFFNQFVHFLVGSLTYIILIGVIGVSVIQLFKINIPSIDRKYYVASALFLLAFLLMQAVLEFRPQPVWEASKQVLSNAIPILTNNVSTKSGILGALFLGIFGSMFDYAGCYLLIVLFIILGGVLAGYDGMKQWLANRPEREKEVIIDDLLDMDDDIEEPNTFVEPNPIEPILPETIVPEPIDSSKHEPQPVIEQEVPTYEPTNFDYGDDSYADYHLPNINVLDEISRKSKSNSNMAAAKEQGKKLIRILAEFDVKAELVQIHIGPTVTKFEVKPELGVRVNRISNLQDDIKMGLAATDIRIEAPIPGKSAIGIEIPNVEKTGVQMRELMRTIPNDLMDKKLLFCLGKDLMGNNVYGQLNRMPHMLIAGATGSGKSVCVNAIICSILMRARPDEVKMILIDPKKVEFTPYNDVPHLLAPVITDGDMANKALKVVVNMMDHRYDLFGELGVRNIQSYNHYVSHHTEENLKPLPQIVVIIDELADLMLVAAKEVESSIQRITQLARAAGIYLLVATQRPSVDVVTGVIKANIPSRIAFAVSQSVDSRTILDQVGAERLLGYGDMLYLPNGQTSPERIQGVFIKDEEVNRIASFVKSQAKPHYDDAFIKLRDIASQGQEAAPESADPLYNDVKSFVIQSQKASTSLIQRKFSVGYARAARLMDILEVQGIIGPSNGSKPREVLVHNTLEDRSDLV